MPLFSTHKNVFEPSSEALAENAVNKWIDSRVGKATNLTSQEDFPVKKKYVI